MVTKKDLVIVVLATFCLTTLLFTTIPSRSADLKREYDPWVDLNGDGRIDILDIAKVASLYGTNGTPMNRTLPDLLDRYNSYVAAYQNIRNQVNRRLWLDPNVTTYYVTPEDPNVIKKVYDTTGGWTNSSDFNEYWDDVKAMYVWIRNNIHYRYDVLYPFLPYDPSQPVQFYQDMWQFPNETLALQSGDCEDQAILLCSMIRCYNQMRYWAECIWIESSTSGHVAVQIPITEHRLVIADPAGDYYSHDFWGFWAFNNITQEINNWLNYWKAGMGNDVHVYRVFSDFGLGYIDRTFASTDEYINWMYNR
jgi:hypothetical protein